ncbi:MAG TPA: hypothetical protein PLG04_09200, partial [Anaerolineaceae bacterium]|nr:hypothetical protein [Anaerolineaceae bacterium]
PRAGRQALRSGGFCKSLTGNKMADINFDCPHCGHNLEVSERGAGLTVVCPECAKSIKIPIPNAKVLVRDIKFNCGSCGRILKVSENMIGQMVDCPACKRTVEVTLLPSASAPQPSRPITPPQLIDQAATPIQGLVPQAHAGRENVDVQRYSSWSGLFNVIGVLCILIGFAGFLIGFIGFINESETTPRLAFIFLISGFGAGLQAFFFAFIIDVFTDIRWLLALIYNKN